jgi:predicted DNA-binding transcriptional regulator YafY
VLDPLGLVANGAVWYLVAVWEGKTSVYRVSRVQDAQVLDEPCLRPEGFDLAEFWRRSSAEYIASIPHYPVTVRVAPDLLPRVRHALGGCLEKESEPDASGWVQVRIRFETEEQACRYAVGFGPRMEVVEPPKLRQRVLELAEGVVSLYARQRMTEETGGAK